MLKRMQLRAIPRATASKWLKKNQFVSKEAFRAMMTEKFNNFIAAFQAKQHDKTLF